MANEQTTPTDRPGWLRRALHYVRGTPQQGVEATLVRLRNQAPAPLLWLFGKTQTGKTSIVRYLTGANDAEIGNGFRPCTRTSRLFPFPSAEAPVLQFLDTRGVGEPGYDPSEDLATFNQLAHVVIVTSRLTDFAHGPLRDSLHRLREAHPRRPILLALTCTHEAYPQIQHPERPLEPAPAEGMAAPYHEALRLIAEQKREFRGLHDRLVAIDLTQPAEGYHDPAYGGDLLKQTLLELLPLAYRETLIQLDAASGDLRQAHLQRAVPTLVGYSTLAAAAGAVPIPFVDLLVLPSIQTKMVHALAELSGQPDNGRRFLELSASLGLGLLARQAVRELAKVIPYVGSAVGAAMAGAATYALGRSFLTYLQKLHDGHAPDAAQIRQLYREHLAEAERRWRTGAGGA